MGFLTFLALILMFVCGFSFGFSSGYKAGMKNTFRKMGYKNIKDFVNKIVSN